MANPTKESYAYDYEPEDSGYQTVNYAWTDESGKEYRYRMRFYRGLVSKIVLWPLGRGDGLPQRTMFTQTETYRFPGGKYDPIPDTTVEIIDEIEDRRVVIAVDDSPKPGHTGKEEVIRSIYMQMYRTEGPPAEGNEWVLPESGRQYIKAILVTKKPYDPTAKPLPIQVPDWAGVPGASVGVGDDPDPEIEVHNTPKTCPFDCD